MNILLNNNIIYFTQEDFPILISGSDGSGASMFSVSLLVEMFKKGEKIVFFSAQEPAKDEFKKQVGNSLNQNALIIESGEENIFLEKIDKILNLSERIILFKNIENYSKNVFDKLDDRKLVIFSGDIDKCIFGNELAKKDFKTKIFFSYTEKIEIKNRPELLKYHGLIISKKYNGIISLDIS